ncbi:MAG: peptide deformylase, partial [Candidatus Portnoybacteria bacterium CG10_big_fil_rev_8_21_14_0_10_36_7]
MAIRTIIQIGHPSLKAKNKLIKSFNSSKVKQLVKDLTDTMYDSGLI